MTNQTVPNRAVSQFVKNSDATYTVILASTHRFPDGRSMRLFALRKDAIAACRLAALVLAADAPNHTPACSAPLPESRATETPDTTAQALHADASEIAARNELQNDRDAARYITYSELTSVCQHWSLRVTCYHFCVRWNDADDESHYIIAEGEIDGPVNADLKPLECSDTIRAEVERHCRVTDDMRLHHS